MEGLSLSINNYTNNNSFVSCGFSKNCDINFDSFVCFTGFLRLNKFSIYTVNCTFYIFFLLIYSLLQLILFKITDFQIGRAAKQEYMDIQPPPPPPYILLYNQIKMEPTKDKQSSSSNNNNNNKEKKA